MTVLVRKQVTVLNKTFPAPQYSSTFITREEKEKADLLDLYLQECVNSINGEYLQKKADFKLSDIDKWRWVGEKLDKILQSGLVSEKDIDNNDIWPAISQYLTDELRRDDTKRSGTAKDHLRKCWLLYKLKGTKWITTWSGWDALVDRGEQLHTDERVLAALENAFAPYAGEINSRDFQYIFKQLTKKIPSGTSRKELNLISYAELTKISNDVVEEWKTYKAT